MNPQAVIRDGVEVMVEGPDTSVLRLGLLVPLSGPLGIVGPSAMCAASLAAAEVNAAGGVRDRRIELVVADAGGRPERVAQEARMLAGTGAVEALVGLHTSDVHRAVESALAGRTPYIFTPPHEGGARRAGVVLLGESPARQLAPALGWLSRQRRLKRWALVGSDYIWAWSVHRAARPLIAASGGEVALERLIPFGMDDDAAGDITQALTRARVDAVLLSLIGRDLARFNRAFTASRLRSKVMRVSGSLEENGLLAAGGDDTGELYAAMRSFAGQQEPRRLALAGNYRRAFGAHAPLLDSYSESCYDGTHLAAALAAVDGLTAPDAQPLAARLLSSERSAMTRLGWSRAPLGRPRRGTYLACADGLDLTVVAAPENRPAFG
jgi:ABC-type branched-subunit amino acid transport system substrate-binding protein